MRRLMIIFIAVLLTGAGLLLPTHAAGGAWEAWLYDREFGRVVKLSHDGAFTSTLLDIVLPADPGSTYSSHIAVSYDGRLIAYTTEFFDGTNTQVRLRIYDSLTGALTTDHPLPPNVYTSLSFHGSMYMFAPDSTSFVIGYSYLTDTGFGWTILIFDPFSGMNVDGLDSSSPITAAFRAAVGEGYLTPVIRYVSSGDAMASIYGTMIYTATEGAPVYPAFRWDVNAMNLVVNPYHVALDMDRAITGDLVLSTHDPALPFAFSDPAGFPMTNVLSGYNPLTATLAPFAYTPGASDPTFIQAAERIAYRRYNPTTFDVEAITVLERSGAVVAEILAPGPAQNVTSMDGTIGGFIFTASAGTGRAGGTTVYRVHTRTGSSPYFTPESVWNSTLGANYVIAWISDEIAPPVETPAPWGTSIGPVLGPPPLMPTLIVPIPTLILPITPAPTPFVIQPIPLPTIQLQPSLIPPIALTPLPPVIVTSIQPIPLPVIPQLQAGGQAIVQTTEGDTLNVRSGPGRSFQVVTRVSSGTVVTIAEGPVSADGFNWWRIVLPNGTTGWAVDSADGVQTLVPR